MDGKKTAFLAFLAGALVGGIAALLLTPTSGSEVRRKIKDELEETVEKVRTEAENLKAKAEELSAKAKEILEEKKRN